MTKLPLTVRQLRTKWLGRKAMLTLMKRGTVGMEFPVTILDARSMTGRVSLLLESVGGIGTQWFAEEYVRVVEQWPLEEEQGDL